jgi:hypothetical protein
MTNPPEKRLGTVVITGALLDTYIGRSVHSEVRVLGLKKYDIENDTWSFVCTGPDFPIHWEGYPSPIVDSEELSKVRATRENSDD